MKNTFGNNLTVTIFGESHGKYIGAVLDGLTPGLEVDEAFISSQLAKRRPSDALSTSRREKDEFIIASGVFEGKTTGSPICILIPNANTHSKDYEKTRYIARPSHADYTANVKYSGYQDYRGGGHFSGRLTAAIVAAGAIVMPSLCEKGIRIASHIKSIEKVQDRDFENLSDDLKILENKDFAVLCDSAKQKMTDVIVDAKNTGDSVGGVIETVIIGLDAGIGEPFFDSIESMLSHALFSIPAVKGVEFGAGFDIAKMRGSEANDPFEIKDGKVITSTNNSGGINGGISNGMPIVFRAALRPTPTIFTVQKTVDFEKNENTFIEAKGRHDPCIVRRAPVIFDSISALVIADFLAGK